MWTVFKKSTHFVNLFIWIHHSLSCNIVNHNAIGYLLQLHLLNSSKHFSFIVVQLFQSLCLCLKVTLQSLLKKRLESHFINRLQQPKSISVNSLSSTSSILCWRAYYAVCSRPSCKQPHWKKIQHQQHIKWQPLLPVNALHVRTLKQGSDSGHWVLSSTYPLLQYSRLTP